MSDMISAKEAGELIGVHASTIGIWIQTRQIEGAKVDGYWQVPRAAAEAKAATYKRPVPTPDERSRITVSRKPPARPGIIDADAMRRAREKVIAVWSECMPEAEARRWFAELLEAMKSD
jgi:hypothetical protein